MPRSGMDIIEIREDVRKRVSEIFNKNLETSMKQLHPQAIQKFIEFFELQFPEKEVSKKNIGEFISNMVASFIVFRKLRSMPRDIYNICKWIDEKSNDNMNDDGMEPF